MHQGSPSARGASRPSARTVRWPAPLAAVAAVAVALAAPAAALAAGSVVEKRHHHHHRRCNPNYSGCLRPDASDYDCRGGSGDGPYYTGPVRVIGYDEYGLDRDHDGIGCEDS